MLLIPLSWLFGALSLLRRLLYKTGLLQSQQLTVPVIIIGNKKSKAATDQIATASKSMLGKKLGAITSDEMKEIEYVLKIQLGLT